MSHRQLETVARRWWTTSESRRPRQQWGSSAHIGCHPRPLALHATAPPPLCTAPYPINNHSKVHCAASLDPRINGWWLCGHTKMEHFVLIHVCMVFPQCFPYLIKHVRSCDKPWASIPKLTSCAQLHDKMLQNVIRSASDFCVHSLLLHIWWFEDR
jgi:hypothetical protein